MTIARLNLAVVAFVSAICCAQINTQTVDSRKLTQLSGPYSGFTEDDVLGKIFDGYDPTTSSISNIPNSENKPARVSILEAKPWRDASNVYLIVLTNLGDTQMLCGNCAMYTPLAVLKTDGTSLSLFARQDLPQRSSVDDNEGVSDTSGSLSHGGHESIALDLAPYRLTDHEMLFGVRIEHVWLAAPFYQTRLFLFRVQDGRITKVWEEPVVDRDYPNAHKDGSQIILKTTSAVSMIRGNEPFYELVVKKATVKCMENEDGDCDLKGGPVKPFKTQTEVWRFDGEKFNLVPQEASKPVLLKGNPA